jgi:hypothetical protein
MRSRASMPRPLKPGPGSFRRRPVRPICAAEFADALICRGTAATRHQESRYAGRYQQAVSGPYPTPRFCDPFAESGYETSARGAVPSYGITPQAAIMKIIHKPTIYAVSAKAGNASFDPAPLQATPRTGSVLAGWGASVLLTVRAPGRRSAEPEWPADQHLQGSGY